MTAEDVKKNNDAILEALDGAPRNLLDPIVQFTRDRMWRLRHIPFSYFVPPDSGAIETLCAELMQYGYIALDGKGEPACLSGKPPIMAHENAA